MTFYHSGQMGDIIYSLPVVKAMGGGDFVTGLDAKLHSAIAPLLAYQDYISTVKHVSEVSLPGKYINLDVFRLKADFNNVHIVDKHLRSLNIKLDWKNSAWISVPFSKQTTSYAVINRTLRYQDNFFRWESEVNWLRKQTDRIYFIGTMEELERFPIPLQLYKCQNLLEAAAIIKNAKFFSGNQSACLAIAQALNRSYRMEQSPNHRDCNTGRSNEVILNSISRKIYWFAANIKRFGQQP